MKLVVDYDLCEANAVCVKTAPDMFRVDEQDKLHLLVTDVDEAHMEKAKAAVRRCPRRALTLVE